eukprot:CAMPEP_0179066388 /NCGR_PEP_ID=MMETSP0796-20121207/28949_1 /TAXON_ID=73915 /ORGANISM="Pyrodinium bahamense, Strain pbaha01" /LENGTH=32 /DNA_ID= /DNA_START= /DNA_END= /DNA_ORIENTATION=
MAAPRFLVLTAAVLLAAGALLAMTARSFVPAP